ncbi:MAG: TRAP transporter substrate-binding protein [Clostridiaceae bacterium]|nr:TRAP transporter substrate-binding protein [Clostridiaceae bacterium]MCI9485216.1 TRAP transporter substrate-binding protein [Clostridiaceae bacterium]
MKPIKRILAGMAAAVSLLALSGCSSQGLDPNHLLVAHSHNENHPVNVGMTALCDEVSGKTQYTFSIYPNGQLGGNEDMIQMVKAGVLDIAKVSSSSLEQFNPAYAIFSLPYTFQSTEHYFRTMRESEAVQEIFRSTYDDGFIAIGWFDSGARSIYTTKDGPCETPDDLRGLKIRTQGSPTSIEMINNMGGAATPMSSGEVYTSLQQGIIDGAENNETVLVDDGHGEVAKSYTYTQHQYTPDIVIISVETWESMSEADQQAVLDAMDNAWEAHEEKWLEIVDRNIEGAKEMGVQFYTIDKTPFIEAVASQQQEFCAASEDNARYFADFLSYVD